MPRWLDRKRIWIIGVLLLVAGAGIWLYQQREVTSSAAEAIENRDVPNPENTTTILVSGDQTYPPYEFINKKGEPDGFNVELIREVAKVANLNVEVKLMPWSEARQALLDGDVDVLAGMYYSEERDRNFEFSIPHNQVMGALFVTSGSPLHSIDDIPGKRIAVEEGDILHDYLISLNEKIEIYPVSDPLTALRGVKSGLYDGALLSSMLQGLYYLDQDKIHGLRVVTMGLAPRAYCFAVREGDTHLLYTLNEGLDVLKETGKYQQIFDHWFGVYEERTTWFSARYLAYGLVGLGLLLGITGLWTNVLRRQVRSRTEDLRRSEEKYRLLVENASEGVMVTIQDRIVYLNRRLDEIFNAQNGQLLGTNFRSWIHPDDLEMVLRHREARSRGEETVSHYPVRGISSNGEVRWLFLHGVQIEWEGQPAILNLLSDITEIIQAEERNKRQYDQLASLRSIDLAITASLDLSVTLSILLEQVVIRLGVDAADVLLYDPIVHQVSRIADYGLVRRIPDGQWIYLGNSLPGAALLSRTSSLDLPLNEVHERVPGSANLVRDGFTSYSCIPLIAKNTVQGVLEIFNRQPLPEHDDWRQFLETLAGQAAIAIDGASMYQNLQKANDNLILAYDTTIEGWARALELRDQETEGHSQRVANMTVELAYRMGIGEEEITHIRRGALLHDIGKMGIPDDILLKPGPLTDEEWVIMRKHPVYAQQLLAEVQFLRPAMAIPYSHHERWDGSGYPLGLIGEQIPLAARIFAVIDVWDALSNDRPYRNAWPTEQVVQYLKDQAGRLLDPAVVEAFLAMQKY